MATNNNTARIATLETEMAAVKADTAQMKSDIADIKEMLKTMAQPKAEKKTSSAKPKKENTFKQDVIVRRATRTEEEKEADRAAAIARADDLNSRQTRLLEKKLGLKAGSLSTMLCTQYDVERAGVKIRRQDLKAVKAEVRAEIKK